MRKPLFARIALALAFVLAGVVGVAAQAAPRAQEADQGAGPARISVVHAAPFGTTQAGTTVTVVATAAGQDLLLSNNFQFGQTIPYLTVPAGSYRVRVFAGSLALPLPSGATPAIDVNVTLAANTDYTAVAIGTGVVPFPLTLRLLTDNTPPPASALAKIRVLHAAPFAPTINDTRVDVVTQNDQVVLSNIPYNNDPAPFADLPAGDYDLKIVRTGTTDLVYDIPPFTLGAGDIVTVIAIGTGQQPFPARVLTLPFVERAPARVRLVHAAPFQANGGPATVTVRVGGQVVNNNFNFRDITPYTTLPAGIYPVEIFAGSTLPPTGTPALTAPLVLQDGQSYTVVAMGTGVAPYQLKLKVLTDDDTPAGSASTRIRAVHAAPFAPTIEATAVDVRFQDGTTIGAGLNNIKYDEVRENIVVPSGTPIDLKITPAGQPTAAPIIDIPPIVFGAGDAVTLIAVGGANGQPGAVLVLDDQSVTQLTYLPLIRR
jgi:hypothetical protein